MREKSQSYFLNFILFSRLIYGGVLFFLYSCNPYFLNKKERVYNSDGNRIISVKDEEGIHTFKSIEWWYHYGFFSEKDSSKYNWSFYSSFIRSTGGRCLMYKITDLNTGKNYYDLVFDKLLKPVSLPIKGNKKVFDYSKNVNEKPGAWLDLNYDNSILKKQNGSYSFVLNDDSLVLSLLISKSDSVNPMLLEGTGIMGKKHPQDIYYYSFPQLSTNGKLKIKDTIHDLKGDVWYDHQWVKPLPNKKVRWCWWGITLDNGDALNLYIVKNILTGKMLFQSATRMDANGKISVYKTINATFQRTWKSPRTNIEYPVEWTLDIPEWGNEMHINAQWDDHEMPILIYNYFWEGPCKVEVKEKTSGKNISSGKGYQELVGFYYDKFKL